MGKTRSSIDLALCFREAWRGFSLWWIPLCTVSAIWLAIEWVRRVHVRTALAQSFAPFADAWRALWADPSPEAAAQFGATCQRLLADPSVGAPLLAGLLTAIKLTFAFAVVASVLTVAIVVIAMAAVKPGKARIDVQRYTRRSPLLALSYLLLGVIKVVPFAFFIVPGVILYVRLYFTSFIITEASANPFTAIKTSWRMTRGESSSVLILFIANIFIDILGVLTVIGFIPANSFNYTLRAAAYRQLRAAGADGDPGA